MNEKRRPVTSAAPHSSDDESQGKRSKLEASQSDFERLGEVLPGVLRALSTESGDPYSALQLDLIASRVEPAMTAPTVASGEAA